MFYKKFCEETFDDKGNLKKFKLKYDPDFNYGYDVIDAIAKESPEKLALIYDDEKDGCGRLSFKDISELSNKAANVFIKYGIKKGDHVLVILKNHFEYWYIAAALHKIGAVICPVFYMLPPPALIYRIKKADVTHLITSPYVDFLPALLKISADEGIKNLFVIRKSVEGFINLTEEIEKAPSDLERIPTLAKDPMLIYFTSGTTGFPKAVMHNHVYSLSQILASRYLLCSEKNGLHLSIGDTGWAVTSGTKFYGTWLVGSALLIYEFDSFSPRKMLETLKKHNVTSFMASPTVYKGLIAEGIDKFNLSALDTLSAGGEALPPKVAEEVYSQTGITLKEGIGQSETGLYIGYTKTTPLKLGSIGKASPKFNTAIYTEDGKPVKSGEFGEAVIIPDNPGENYQDGVLMGYYKDEEAYKNAWRFGVFHTGDFVRSDEEGYFFYGGRVDDLIKTKGYRVSPFEIEDVLIRHPAVFECMVTGVPDEYMGNIIKAYAVLNKGYEKSDALRNELMEFSNKQLAGYMKIRELEFAESLEKSVNGKIVHK